ncbi:unnamed protein product [Staurois parvus]|uniref:Uncharacterized protein n=1 Tax=Staurois parvus TaxID=386267 RepID=A0ABN9D2N2_9NEOB|nr:unnamed protein product [Staurois parvus]
MFFTDKTRLYTYQRSNR